MMSLRTARMGGGLNIQLGSVMFFGCSHIPDIRRDCGEHKFMRVLKKKLISSRISREFTKTLLVCWWKITQCLMILEIYQTAFGEHTRYG